MRLYLQVGCIVLILFACSAMTQASGNSNLTHRYSFNDGTANDSAGHINGTLVNGASVSSGQLRFDPAINNGSNNAAFGQYVSLPANILFTQSFTVEAWATEQSTKPWQRIVDMGNTVNGNGQGFLILTPYNNPGGTTGQISLYDWGGTSDTNFVAGRLSTGVVAIGREYQYAYVHDLSLGVESLYINGTLVATSSANVDPTLTSYTNFYIGRSQFTADPYFDGSINELRTYNIGLSGSQIAADYLAGPDGISVPEPGVMLLAVVPMMMLRRRRVRGT